MSSFSFAVIAVSVYLQQASPDAGVPSITVTFEETGGAKVGKTIDLVKDRSIELVVRQSPTNGPTSRVPVTVTVSPSETVSIEEKSDGRMTVTALKDVFDRSDGKEPRATVMACAGASCASVDVLCLPDVNARWDISLRFTIPHSEERHSEFVQRGRIVKFEAEPGKIATLRIDGKKVKMIDGGGVLTVFDGYFLDRRTAGGKWASSWGFGGTWIAKRQ